jgi:hypothetical protein
LATATTQTTRRRGAKPIARRRRARPQARPAATASRRAMHFGRLLGIASLVTVGAIVVLGTAALAVAAVDPRADALIRRGLREARDSARQLPSQLPEVHLPSVHRLESVAHQIAEAGQKLVGQIRDAARDRF